MGSFGGEILAWIRLLTGCFPTARGDGGSGRRLVERGISVYEVT